MERLPGRVLLQEISRPAELADHPLRVPRLVYEALARVPRLLGELQAHLHRLDAEPLRAGLRGVGLMGGPGSRELSCAQSSAPPQRGSPQSG